MWDTIKDYVFFFSIFFISTLFLFIIKKYLFRWTPILRKIKFITPSIPISAFYLSEKIYPLGKIKNLDSYFYIFIWFVIFYNIFIIIDEIFFDYYLITKKKMAIPQILRNLIKILIISLFIALFLSKYLPKLSVSYFASLGVFSVIVGLALQSLLADIFAGIIISINSPIKVHDWIQFDDNEGEIIEINWYNTKIKTLNEHIIVVPNGNILRSTITNFSQPVKRERIMLDIGVSYDNAPDEVETAIKEAAKGIDKIIPKYGISVYLDKYDDFSINYKIIFYVENKKFLPEIKNRLYKNIYYAFKRHNIEIPYPITTIGKLRPTVKENLPKLQKFDFFSFMDTNEFEEFSSIGKTLKYGKEEYILKEGDTATGLYVILKGKVLINKKGKTLAELNTGDVLGEISLIKDAPISADCICATETIVYFVEKELIYQHLKNHHTFLTKLSELVVEREIANSKLTVNDEKKEKMIKKENRKILSKIFKFFED